MPDAAGPPRFFPGLEETLWNRQAREPGAGRAARRAAWERYAALPLPAPNDDGGRGIHPDRLNFAAARALPRLPLRNDPPAEHPLDADFDVVLALDAEGIRIADRSGAVRNGALRVEAPGDADEFETGFPADAEMDKLSWASLAFWNAGVRMIAAPGCRLERGILIRGRADAPGSLWIARVGIEAGAGSRLGIAQVWESGEASDSVVLAATRARAAPGAILRGVSFQNLGPRGRAVWTESLSAAERAEAEWTSLPLGGDWALNRVAAVAAGSGANLRLRGPCLVAGNRQVDQKTIQDHRAPDTTSHLLFKAIARDRARSVFRGVIRARPGALRIDAYQKNPNLVLDDGARADSLPVLLIEADDLKCTHGSTIGSLDPDALFYLRSRGLTEPAARGLLIEGFTEDILGPIPWPALRDHARARIATSREALAEPPLPVRKAPHSEVGIQNLR